MNENPMAKPKTDSPFAARASTRAPFAAAQSGVKSGEAPPPVVASLKANSGGSAWPLGLIAAVVLICGGGAAWWFLRDNRLPQADSIPVASAPSSSSAASAQVSAKDPASVVVTPATAAVAQESKVSFERLAAFASKLEMNAQDRAVFASAMLTASQAQSGLNDKDFSNAVKRWSDAGKSLGPLVGAQLKSAYETESAPLRGLNLSEYTGPDVKALGEALALADAATVKGEWTEVAVRRQEARDLLAKAQTQIANQLGEVAKAAVARGENDLATYFYERALRLDSSLPAARHHLYANKFKAAEIIRTSFGMELAYIPPGGFTRGSTAREPGRSADESLREVRLSQGFFLGVKEVTQRDWDAVFGEGAAARTLLASRTVKDAKVREGWIALDLPMHSVRWEDVQEFCRRLSALEKKTFRLPTEAEWEYACRAGLTTAFNTGSDGLSARDANIDDGSTAARYALAPVGTSGKANRFGLFDMHGNVWEWCADWSVPYPSGLGVLSDPSGPSEADAGRLDVAMKVVRGGGWNADASDARAANRAESSPVVGLGYIGLRVVQEPVLINP